MFGFAALCWGPDPDWLFCGERAPRPQCCIPRRNEKSAAGQNEARRTFVCAIYSRVCAVKAKNSVRADVEQCHTQYLEISPEMEDAAVQYVFWKATWNETADIAATWAEPCTTCTVCPTRFEENKDTLPTTQDSLTGNRVPTRTSLTRLPLREWGFEQSFSFPVSGTGCVLMEYKTSFQELDQHVRREMCAYLNAEWPHNYGTFSSIDRGPLPWYELLYSVYSCPVCINYKLYRKRHYLLSVATKKNPTT